MNPLFAVMGKPISHSLSPAIHHYFAKKSGISLEYKKIEVAHADFAAEVSYFFEKGGKGLNITLPFKEESFKLANVVTTRCEKIKAANTLWIEKGNLHADTTDGIGFITDISRYISLTNKRILLLGAGGAARSILPALFEAGILSVTLVNRTVSKAKALQNAFPQVICKDINNINSNFDLVINATAAGLSTSHFSLPRFNLSPTTFYYDLVYNLRAPTPFVKWAQEKKCDAVDGLGMLIEQAAASFYIWHGIKPDTDELIRNKSLLLD